MLLFIYLSAFCFAKLVVTESVDKNNSDKVEQNCSIPKECRRTCASPNPRNCFHTPSDINIDGCNCKEGFLLSEINGSCITVQECPANKGCNGDIHAIAKLCPMHCPPTCQTPDVTTACNATCEPVGCECQPGYLRSNENGNCILPSECPGGNPCPVNAEFRACKYVCPQDFCPENDNTDRIACDPFPICVPGCACRLNHRMLSYENKTCVVASECPPINCTRPNEVWDGCPSECFSGNCSDREYQDVVCNTFVLNCQPKCICKRDTFRNESGICVPASECPPLNEA